MVQTATTTQERVRRRAADFYRRVATVGLLLFATAFVVQLVLSLLQGVGDHLAFLISFPLLSFIVASFTWSHGGQLLVAAAVFAVLSLLVNSLVFAFGLTHPDSFFDFFLALLASVGLLLTVAGSTVAYTQERRWAIRVVTLGEVQLIAAVGIAVVALGGLSAILDVAGRTEISAEARGDSVEVLMKGVRFEPETVRIQASESLRLLVKNRDFTLHTITIEDLKIDESLRSRSEAVVDLSKAGPGEYEITCTVPGHEKMTGTLVVTE